ncbi:hypothetical protein AYK24_07245 [Thermoplasmatales archaeon SG8-52-4]|nr:MAG: hypothetical protein AYK24_07245 [Thermoplasmatales archaeon SG8-52-4]
MKVIFMGTLPPIIGLSPYCLHLSNALSKKIDLEFLGFKEFSKKSKSFYREFKIDETLYIDILKHIKIKKILSWYNPFSAIKAGLKIKADILHVQWWLSSLIFIYLPVMILAKLKNIKIVLTVHNILPHEQNRKNLILDKFVSRLIFLFADVFIVHNKRNKKKFIETYRLHKKNIHIITHGVLNLIKQRAISSQNARKYLHLQLNKKIVLFFGYIRKYKGLDVLINAFSLIHNQIKDAFLLIVGQPYKESWDNYEKLLKVNNLEKCSKVELGFIPESEIEYYFSAADIVALPYIYLDTHGGVGALALAFKKPLVVTDVGGLPEYVKDKKVIAYPKNPEDLALKIIRVLNNKQFKKKLSNDSKKLSIELNWDEIADKTIKIYNSLL